MNTITTSAINVLSSFPKTMRKEYLKEIENGMMTNSTNMES